MVSPSRETERNQEKPKHSSCFRYFSYFLWRKFDPETQNILIGVSGVLWFPWFPLFLDFISKLKKIFWLFWKKWGNQRNHLFLPLLMTAIRFSKKTFEADMVLDIWFLLLKKPRETKRNQTTSFEYGFPRFPQKVLSFMHQILPCMQEVIRLLRLVSSQSKLFLKHFLTNGNKRNFPFSPICSNS